jgi:parallel beta-helix repeat protein
MQSFRLNALLLTGSMFLLIMILTPYSTLASTISVPTDYPTIQGAINAANPGDTITVSNGTYHENVAINKAISLIGNGHPIVDGSNGLYAIKINANGVSLQGFGVTDARNGIYVNSSGNNIIGNTASGNAIGIYLYHSNNNVLTGNIANNNRIAGFDVEYSYNNNITENTAVKDVCGILFYNTADINISRNIVHDNKYGISLDKTRNNNVSYNTINNNYYGIYLFNNASCNYVIGNRIDNSVKNGIRLSEIYDNYIWLNRVDGYSANAYVYNGGANRWISEIPTLYT